MDESSTETSPTIEVTPQLTADEVNKWLEKTKEDSSYFEFSCGDVV